MASEVKKNIPGKYWDILNTKLTPETISTIEIEIVELLAFLEKNPECLLDTWFNANNSLTNLFDSEISKTSERIYQKMRNSGSWVLSITARLMALMSVSFKAISISALGGKMPETGTLCENLKNAEMRQAQTVLENCFIENLIAFMKANTIMELSVDGLDAFLNKNLKQEQAKQPVQKRKYSFQSELGASGMSHTESAEPIQIDSHRLVDPNQVIEHFKQQSEAIVPKNFDVVKSKDTQLFQAIDGVSLNGGTFLSRKKAYNVRKVEEKNSYDGAIARQSEEIAGKKEKNSSFLKIIAIIAGIILLILLPWLLSYLPFGALAVVGVIMLVISVIIAFAAKIGFWGFVITYIILGAVFYSIPLGIGQARENKHYEQEIVEIQQDFIGTYSGTYKGWNAITGETNCSGSFVVETFSEDGITGYFDFYEESSHGQITFKGSIERGETDFETNTYVFRVKFQEWVENPYLAASKSISQGTETQVVISADGTLSCEEFGIQFNREGPVTY